MCLLSGSMALAQAIPAPWVVQSPEPEAVIAADELFVVVGLDAGLRLNTRTVEILLNEEDLRAQARAEPARVVVKLSERTIRVLYLDPLPAGAHELRITARTTDGGRLPPLAWRFRILEEGARAGAAVAARPTLRLSGQTFVQSRGATVSGDADLLQQQARIGVVQANVSGRYGTLTFPVRLYLTTEASGRFQRRNRVMVGVQAARYQLLLGDTTPRFAELLLNGTRTRGFQGELHLGWLHIFTAWGELRRALEPDLGRLLPGTFQRNMLAVRLAFGRERGVLFGINFMKAKDAQSSVRADSVGATPEENLVAGTDLRIRGWRGRVQLKTGVALSVRTEDLARGPITKAEIDSLYDVDLPLDPKDLTWLITLNGSTVPLRLDRLSSLAWYADARFSLFDHLVTSEYSSVGEAFFSFANPFLQNDRRQWTLTDRFRAWGGRIAGLLRYRGYGAQPRTEPSLPSLSGRLYLTRFTVTPSPTAPRLFLSYQLHERKRFIRGTAFGDSLLSNSHQHTISLGGFAQATTGRVEHTANVFWTYNRRDDGIRPSSNNVTHNLSLNLLERLGPMQLQLQATRLRIEFGGLVQRWHTFGGRFAYRFERRRLDLAFTARNTHGDATTFSPASDRLLLALSGNWEIRPRMTLELQAGTNLYREAGRDGLGYTEHFVVLQHRYAF